MFEPQPTPFASNSFATYGLATDLDFGYPVPAGGGGAGSFLYTSQPPLPLRQHQQHQHQQRRQQQHQNQPLQLPSPSSSASSPYGTSGANSGSHLPPSPESRPDLSRFLQPYDTSAIKMEDQSQHDLAAQQDAAKEYQHIHEDPLVGNKTSSDAITQQYAEADPIYIEKTMALPQTYSHYRSIRGDGNCGWRAIGFSYFEKLIETGDQNVVEGEMARLMSVNSLLERVGGYAYWEDFADGMLGLLRMIAGHMNNPAMAHAVLLEQWNDSDVTNGIIYYLRLLAATYLKNSGGAYDAFVEIPGGVQAYCGSHIEPVNKEIEHLGILALFNILLQPPGMVLEIVYLDRSAGSQVNTYRFPEEATGQDLASFGAPIYLLYRPDHYDILYRAPPPPPIQIPTQPISMQVNRVAGFSHNTTLTDTQNTLDGFSNMDYGLLSMIPGFSGSMSGMAPLAPPPPAVCSPPDYSPVQQNNWMPQFSEVLQSPTPQPTPQQPAVVSPPQPPSPPTPLPSSSSSMCPPMVTTSGLGRRGSLIPPSKAGSYHIRFSPVQLDYEESKSNFPEPTFQVTTNTFKNSVWNRAHYGNPDFHPEEWSPDDEHMDCRTTSKKKVKKESSH